MSEFTLGQQLQRVGETPDAIGNESLELIKRISASMDPAFLEREPAAVCVLFRGPDFARSQVLLTLRSATLATHASQVAFPGGSMDPDDQHDPKRAALRECREEVGIPERMIEPHAVLQAYPTFGGSFMVHPVLSSLHSEAGETPLILEPNEVVQAEWVSVAELMRNRQVEERVVQGHAIKAPFFMWGENKMWGLSAWIFDSILHRYTKLYAKL